MAIFSRKHSGKKVDDQPKVIIDKSVDDPSANESAAAQSPAEVSASTHDGAESTVPAQTAAATEGVPEPVSPGTDKSEPQEVEPESLTPQVVAVSRFGIDDAIQLMRSLPADPNMALVTRVVRVTLSAVNVSIDEIVQDAHRKEARIKESIAAIEAQMGDLEKQLSALRREIATHQADLKETVGVRERLHMAEQAPHKTFPPPIATMARATPSKPFTS